MINPLGLRPAGPSCAPTGVPAAPDLTSVAGREGEGVGGQCTRGGTMAGAGDTLASSTGPPASTTWPPGPPAGEITLSTEYLHNIYTLSIHTIYTVLVVAEPAPPRPSTPPWRGLAPPRTGPPPAHTTRRRSALFTVSTISIIVSTMSIIVYTISTMYIQYLP